MRRVRELGQRLKLELRLELELGLELTHELKIHFILLI